jgi:hypothetical protein
MIIHNPNAFYAEGLNVKNVKKCKKAYQVFLDNAKQQAILIAQIQEKLLMYQRFEAEVLSTVDDHEGLFVCCRYEY